MHCLAFLLLQQLVASFFFLSGSPQQLRTQEMLEMGRTGSYSWPGATWGSCSRSREKMLLPLCFSWSYFWHLLASQLPRSCL